MSNKIVRDKIILEIDQKVFDEYIKALVRLTLIIFDDLKKC